MRLAKLLTLSVLVAGLSACSNFNVNVKDNPPEFPAPLLADGYFNFDGLREYDGSILDVSFLGTGGRKGELLHVELWPIAGVGIGALGFRIQFLPIDLGIGTILYEPSATTGSDEAAATDAGE